MTNDTVQVQSASENLDSILEKQRRIRHLGGLIMDRITGPMPQEINLDSPPVEGIEPKLHEAHRLANTSIALLEDILAKL